MRKILKIIFLLFSIIFLFYVALPNPDFPKPPPDSFQSQEPADTETPLRRAYFTNYSRAEVLDFYQNQFSKSSFWGISIPTLRLNYPPEESQTIIRDQTRSTFLQEIVHPFRESIYINGFEPKEARDAIFIEGRSWRQKIIIRLVPSQTPSRLLITLVTLVLIAILYREYKKMNWRKNA